MQSMPYYSTPLGLRVLETRLVLAILLGLAAGMFALSATAQAEAGTYGVESVIRAVKQDLAEREGVDPESIDVLRIESVTWRDGCLGVYRPGMYCTTALVPGYVVWLGIDDRTWRYHTNSTGSVIILAAGPFPFVPSLNLHPSHATNSPSYCLSTGVRYWPNLRCSSRRQEWTSLPSQTVISGQLSHMSTRPAGRTSGAWMMPMETP